jgi:hypothetical protein
MVEQADYSILPIDLMIREFWGKCPVKYDTTGNGDEAIRPGHFGV